MPIFMYQMADINTCYFVLYIQVYSSWSVCWKEWLCQLEGVKITTVRLAHDADLIATQQILHM